MVTFFRSISMRALLDCRIALPYLVAAYCHRIDGIIPNSVSVRS
jgi:hypothetical protein